MLFTVLAGASVALACISLAAIIRDAANERPPEPVVVMLCVALFVLAAVCYDSGSTALATQALAACEPTI